MPVETYILKKNTILFRSSIDICKMYKKDLKKYKEKCEDTDKIGLYFSDSIQVPIGMSFEYLAKYGVSSFKNHQIGKFIVKEDIKVYVGKYSFRHEELGGEGSENYEQSPTDNYNHTDKISVIQDMNKDKDLIYNIIFSEYESAYNEYFIGIDSDLDKIGLVEVYDFNIKKFQEYVLREKDNFIENLFENLFENKETGLRNIICEEDGRRKSVKQKSRRRKSVKQKSRRRKSRRRKSS